MWERAAATSSSAAEAVEEALVPRDQPRDRRRIGVGIEIIALGGAAEDDPVRPRKHVAGPATQRIANLGLRKQDRQLPFEWMQVLVAKQLSRSETGAIEHQRFG